MFSYGMGLATDLDLGHFYSLLLVLAFFVAPPIVIQSVLSFGLIRAMQLRSLSVIEGI